MKQSVVYIEKIKYIFLIRKLLSIPFVHHNVDKWTTVNILTIHVIAKMQMQIKH